MLIRLMVNKRHQVNLQIYLIKLLMLLLMQVQHIIGELKRVMEQIVATLLFIHLKRISLKISNKCIFIENLTIEKYIYFFTNYNFLL